MPAAPVAREVPLRVAVERPTPGPPAPGSVAEKVVKIRQKLAENPRSATEEIAKREQLNQSLDEGRINALNEQNFGFDKNADGTKKRPTRSEVLKRFNEAEWRSQLARDYAEKGYDQLGSVIDKNGLLGSTIDLKAEARKLTKEALTVNSDIKDILDGMSHGDQDATIEALLRDPDMQLKIREAFQKATDLSKAISDEVIGEAKNRFEEAQHIENQKKIDADAKQKELQQIRYELDRFEDQRVTGGVQGDKHKALEDLTTQFTTIQAGKLTRETSLRALNDRLRVYESSLQAAYRSGDRAAIAKLNMEVNNNLSKKTILENEIELLKADIQRKVDLEAEKQQLELRRQQVEPEDLKLQGELKVVRNERFRLHADYNGEQLSRKQQELDYLKGLQNVFTEGTNEYVKEKVQLAETAQEQVISQEGDETVKKVLKALNESYDTTKGIFKKNEISKHFNILMAKGPEEVVVKVLEKSGMTEADARVKVTDKVFMDKVQSAVTERLLTRRIQTDKLSREQARFIFESEWGKVMLDNAIANKKGIKEAFDKLKEDSVLKGGVREWYKGKSDGSLLKLLLLIFGSAVTLGVLPATMNMKEALNAA